METEIRQITDKQKEYCAVTVMRRMIEKYAEKQNLSFDEAMLIFTGSSVYEALFDYDTGIWKEGPDYLMELFEDALKDTV